MYSKDSTEVSFCNNSFTYKASFCVSKAENRKLYSRKNCIMPISVGQGQAAHEGERFISTIRLAAQKFSKIVILVDDSVQRHTREIFHPNESKQELYLKSMSIGDEWLRTYRPYIKKICGNEVIILRWDHWLNKKEFPLAKERIESELRSDPEFKSAFDESAREFLNRARDRGRIFDDYRGYNLCIKYLIEETAAFTLWPTGTGVDGKVEVELYPSLKRNSAMQVVNRKIICPDNSDLINGIEHTGVRLKKVCLLHEKELILS